MNLNVNFKNVQQSDKHKLNSFKSPPLQCRSSKRNLKESRQSITMTKVQFRDLGYQKDSKKNANNLPSCNMNGIVEMAEATVSIKEETVKQAINICNQSKPLRLQNL